MCVGIYTRTYNVSITFLLLMFYFYLSTNISDFFSLITRLSTKTFLRVRLDTLLFFICDLMCLCVCMCMYFYNPTKSFNGKTERIIYCKCPITTRREGEYYRKLLSITVNK
jgi:hypothetical protein